MFCLRGHDDSPLERKVLSLGFSFKIESLDKKEIVYFSGYIDENADFQSIQPKDVPQLVIDLKGVEHLNSLGLRTWVNWVKSLPQYPGGIFLRHCPSSVVHQMNILEGFLPLQAVIESLEVPFLCDHCGHSSSFWAKRGTDYREASTDNAGFVKVPLELPCEKCGKTASADIIPNKHFSFINRRKRK